MGRPQRYARERSTLVALLLYVLFATMFAKAEEMGGKENAFGVSNLAIADGTDANTACEERIQKEVWETFTSQIDSIRQSLDESNQRVQEAEHAKAETERILTARVDELSGQSTTFQAKLNKSYQQANSSNDRAREWKSSYKQSEALVISTERERKALQDSVQTLQERSVAVGTENAQRQHNMAAQLEAARAEVMERMSGRLRHVLASNEKLTAKEQELTESVQRYADQLQATKAKLFDVRQELYRANNRLRSLAKEGTAFRDFWVNCYEAIKAVIEELNKQARPVYDLASPIGERLASVWEDLALYHHARLIGDRAAHETKILLARLPIWFQLSKDFVSPRASHLLAAARDAVAPCWTDAVANTAPFRTAVALNVEEVAIPAMKYASTKHAQASRWLESIQEILMQGLRLSLETLLAYLVLEEAPNALISITRHANSNPKATVIYTEAFLATLLAVMLGSSLLRRRQVNSASKPIKPDEKESSPKENTTKVSFAKAS